MNTSLARACLLALLVGGCGSSGDALESAPGGDGGTVGDSGEPTSCDAFGHYGTAKTTFTLPSGKASIDYDDIQKSFPDVDWANLDRLYIPAGSYKSLYLHGLPTRKADRPLVITNLGGQVKVGPNDPGGNFIWSMSGGANWILTGRYDPESKTGDAAFPGHRCGDYAGSRGKYGFLSDDAYAKGTYLHMGVAVGGATDFELEYLEVTRSGFAGIRLINERKAGEPAFDMANVRVHDNYIHDTDGEGFYFGWTGAPPSNLFPQLSIYDNRIVRTGNEPLQIQDLGDGSEIHHNVFAYGALHWRDNGLGHYQDNNAQVLVRSGNVSLHHNVFVGGSGTILSFFSAPEEGDGPRHVTFRDNYFADTLSLGAYLNGTSTADSSFVFDHDTFTGMAFGYDKLDPAAKEPATIFGKSDAMKGTITFTGTLFDGSRTLIDGSTEKPVASVPRVEFVDGQDEDRDPKRHLEAWAPVATVSPGKPAIEYQPGDRVTYDAVVYECLQKSSGETPRDHPSSWKSLPLPIDDLRVKPGSAYSEYGVR